jgi:hypothetical protein
MESGYHTAGVVFHYVTKMIDESIVK